MRVRTRVPVTPFWVMCFRSKCITACELNHKYTESFLISSMLPSRFTASCCMRLQTTFFRYWCDNYYHECLSTEVQKNTLSEKFWSLPFIKERKEFRRKRLWWRSYFNLTAALINSKTTYSYRWIHTVNHLTVWHFTLSILDTLRC